MKAKKSTLKTKPIELEVGSATFAIKPLKVVGEPGKDGYYKSVILVDDDQAIGTLAAALDKATRLHETEKSAVYLAASVVTAGMLASVKKTGPIVLKPSLSTRLTAARNPKDL